MPPRLPTTTITAWRAPQLCLRHRQCLRPISSTARRRAAPPRTGFANRAAPGGAPNLQDTPLPSRPPDIPSDSSNPSLIPPRNRRSPEVSTKANDTNAANSTTESLTELLNDNFAKRQPPRQSQQQQYQQYQQTTRRTRLPDHSKATARHRADLEAQMSRAWREGDVYAPHDLSPVEMTKARDARAPRGRKGRNVGIVNTRRKGGRDVIDELGINPMAEYKNMAMMGEYVSELGRIRHARETGLRAVNQRKMARAIRRAIGIGLMPSVHRHPELHAERATARGQTNQGKGFFA